MNKFKLGLDLHGVIDDMPEEIVFLANAVLAAGGEVHIITGGSINANTVEKLEKLNVNYSSLFSVYDYLVTIEAESTGIIEFPDGERQLKFKDEEWNKVKGDYCKKNQISLHLDDTLVYGDHFTTPFARVWTKDKTSRKTHRIVM